jgi:hypothetical protein
MIGRNGFLNHKGDTDYGTALTIILPVLFQYCYKYCYNDSRNLSAVMKAGGLALYGEPNYL